MAGWATSAGGADSRRYYLGGMSSRACLPDHGKLTIARAPTVVAKAYGPGSRLYLAFQLAGQPLTYVVYVVGSTSGRFPRSNGLLPQHHDTAAGTISLSGGGGDDDDDDGGEDDQEGKGKKSKRSGEGHGDDDVSPASESSTGTTSDGSGPAA